MSFLERPYLACPPGADCAVKFRLRLFKGFGSASGRSCFPAGSKLPAVFGLVFAGLYLWHFKETILQKLTGKWFILLIVFICYKVCWQTFGWNLPGYYADLVTSLLLPAVVLACAYGWKKHRLKNDLSYGIFLYHWPLINLVFYWNLPKRCITFRCFFCMWQDFLRWRAHRGFYWNAMC